MAATIDVDSTRGRSARAPQDDMDIEAFPNDSHPPARDTAPSYTSAPSPSPSGEPTEVIESTTPREGSGIDSSLRRRHSSPSPHFPGCLMQHVGECPRSEPNANSRWPRDANSGVPPGLTPSSNSLASQDGEGGMTQGGWQTGDGRRQRWRPVNSRQAGCFHPPQEVGHDLKWQASQRRDITLKYVS
jgi:hypothetical protein